MSALFIKLLNMSITAGWLILLILLFRRIFRNAPKWLNYFLWGVVAFRLMCPVSIESVLSLVPSQETVSQDIVYEKYPTIESGSVAVNNIINPVISTVFEATPVYSANPIQIALYIVSQIWVIGLFVFLIYGIVSYIRIRRQVQEAVLLEENIWQCDHVTTPFLLGIFCPRVYVPSFLNETQMKYVIAHERVHIRHKDYLWKPLGFALLTVYWFNPLIWIAYITLCKDIELACDERVIKNMSGEEKKAYSTALLECSISRHMISACPVAFGEVSVERRVNTVLNYKKPGFWVTMVAVLLCIGVVVGFLTNPVIEGVQETNVYGTYVLAKGDGSIARHRYLILREDNVFLWSEHMDGSASGGGSRLTGSYTVEDNVITLRVDKKTNYILEMNGDELTFGNDYTKSVFKSYAENGATDSEETHFLRLSSYEMKEGGCPIDVIEAMDNASKEKLFQTGWGAPTTYMEYYYDKDGNVTSFERRSQVEYQEPENIDEYVLKLTLFVSSRAHVDFYDDYYESNLDGAIVICFYEWLQPPSSFTNEYKMQLSWQSDIFQMKDDGFVKIDKYVIDGEEYIYSYEPGYAKGSPYDVSWYTKVKGTMGAEPERLYGCAIIVLETMKEVGDLNSNFLLEYEVKNRTVQAIEEFSWEHFIVHTATE